MTKVCFLLAQLRSLTPKGLRLVYANLPGGRTIAILLQHLTTVIPTTRMVSSMTHRNALLYPIVQQVVADHRHHCPILPLVEVHHCRHWSPPSSEFVATATQSNHPSVSITITPTLNQTFLETGRGR
jgi:hypothetical protein